MRLGGSFWRLLVSSATSNLADGVLLIAFPLLAASLTRDPVPISAIEAIAYVPWLLFAVPIGAVVDRLDRRRAMISANWARAAVFLALGVVVVARLEHMWVLYVVTFVVGLAEVLYDSSARAILPQVLTKEQLDRGNSYLTVGEIVTNNFAGAPIGGLLFAFVAASPFLGSGAAYLVGALLLLSVSGDFKVERTVRTTLRADVGEGLRWLWDHRFLRWLSLSSGWFGLMQAMVNGIGVLYALEWLGLTQRQFGFLISFVAVGSLLGGLVAPRLSAAVGRSRALLAATVLSPLCLVAMGLTHSPYVAGAEYAVSAAAVTVWNVLSMSIRQAMIPGVLFGRVLGAYRMIIWGVIPLGALLGGLVASALNLGAVFVVAGLGQLSAAVMIGRLLRRHHAEVSAAYA